MADHRLARTGQKDTETAPNAQARDRPRSRFVGFLVAALPVLAVFPAFGVVLLVANVNGDLGLPLLVVSTVGLMVWAYARTRRWTPVVLVLLITVAFVAVGVLRALSETY